MSKEIVQASYGRYSPFQFRSNTAYRVLRVVFDPLRNAWTVMGRGYALRGQRTAHASTSLCSNGTEIYCISLVVRAVP